MNKYQILSYLSDKINKNGFRSRSLKNFIKNGNVELSEFHLAYHEWETIRNQQKALKQCKRTIMRQN